MDEAKAGEGVGVGEGERRWVEVDDIRIHYRECGPERPGPQGDPAPLVLVHGGFATADSWQAQIEAFRVQHRVIAPDSRAHGRTSDAAAPLTYERLADDLAGLLDALAIERANFIGWSDGGVSSLLLALQRPERVEQLVLLGTPYHIDNYRTPAAQLLGPAIGLIEHGVGVPGFNPRDLYRECAPDPEHWPDFVAKMRTMWLSSPTLGEEDLARVSARTLVVGVDHDEFLAPAVFERTAAAIPHAELGVIEGGNHFVAMQQPEETNALILEFLAKG